MNMQTIPDVMRRFRRSARSPRLRFMQPNTMVLTVGTAVIPLLTGPRIPATQVLLSADQLNADTIYVGGQSVSITNGVELTAGRAVLFSTPDMPAQQSAYRLLPQVEGGAPMPFVPGTGGDEEHIVIALNDIWVVADAAAQILRICYFQWTDPVS